MWRRRKVSTLIRNFLNATSTRRSTLGSSEGAPSKTLILTESGASKNEEQAGESGPRATLMLEKSVFLAAFK
eukprot:jgi/Bigna1/64157/fgenesh1_kg.68_\